jgi:glycerol uptake facilitator-like aquaporin
LTKIEWHRFGTIWIVVLGPLIGGILSTYFFELVYKPYLKKEEP